MNDAMKYPGVGVGIWIRKNGKVLLGLRKGAYGPGMWCPPGGKLDMYESWEDCARREAMEEAGIKVGNLRQIAVVNDAIPEVGSHYVTIHFAVDIVAGQPAVMEPEKCERWEWFAWDELPEPLFWPARNFADSGYNPLNFT